MMHLLRRVATSISEPVQNGSAGVRAPLTEAAVYAALRDVMDPEIGMNVVDLGLVCDVAIDASSVRVTMIMTTPACPMGEMIADDARARLRDIARDGVDIDVELASAPPWSPARMSDEAKRRLGW